jgi:hypothetical protein
MVEQFCGHRLLKNMHTYISTRKDVHFHDCDYEEYHILDCGAVCYGTRIVSEELMPQTAGFSEVPTDLSDLFSPLRRGQSLSV